MNEILTYNYSTTAEWFSNKVKYVDYEVKSFIEEMEEGK